MYSQNGRQRFYLKPASGVSVDEVFNAVDGRLQRKYQILSQEEVGMARERVTNIDDMEAAREVVKHLATSREDGQYEVVGVFATLKGNFGWSRQKTTAALTNLLHSKFLVKQGTTTRNHRRTTIYLVPSMISEVQEPPSPSAESELASLLAQHPRVTEQIVDSLWASKAERLETIKLEILTLEGQKSEIEGKLEGFQSELISLGAEIKHIEGISDRLHQHQP
ncbi:MAG TPA: hypothetical protein VJK26_00480 [Patescibacteria group bacterium]|nr:hypothetical protein [Patescibacteria group bacterium]